MTQSEQLMNKNGTANAKQLQSKVKYMKRTTLIIAVMLLALARSAQADFVQTFNTGFQNGGVIPDGDLSGWSDTRVLSGLDPTGIKQLNVTLNLSGGWNGDLYAYLVHNSGFAVLLNRVGSTAANEAGFSTAGLMHVTLDDTALLNIHSVAEPAAWGHYHSDSRNISPLSSGALFDATTPGAMLTSFNGLDPNGSWTLFIADASGGDQSVLTSWTLAAVPEPGSAEMGAIAVLFIGAVIGVYRLRVQVSVLTIDTKARPAEFVERFGETQWAACSSWGILIRTLRKCQ